MNHTITFDKPDRYPPKNRPSYLAYHQSKLADILVMTGGGSANAMCGQVKFGIRCVNPSCSEPHASLATYSCNRLGCPICRDKAISRSARSIADRIEGMHEAYGREGAKTGPISHVQISTDPNSPEMSEEVLSTPEGYRAALKKVYALFRGHTYQYGGVLIFHPWRQVHEDGTPCGVFKCQREHVWEWSPHWHFLGWGFFRKSDEFYRLTGWTYSKLGRGVKLGENDESERSAFATAYYQLTHAGIFMDRHGKRQNGQAIRYIGMLGNSKGGFNEETVSVNVASCETCKGDLHEYGVHVNRRTREVQFMDDWGLHRETVTEKIWYLNATKSRHR